MYRFTETASWISSLTTRKARSMRMAGVRLEGTKMRPSPTQIRMSGQFEATNWRISLGEDVSSFPLIVFEDKLSDLTDSFTSFHQSLAMETIMRRATTI